LNCVLVHYCCSVRQSQGSAGRVSEMLIEIGFRVCIHRVRVRIYVYKYLWLGLHLLRLQRESRVQTRQIIRASMHPPLPRLPLAHLPPIIHGSIPSTVTFSFSPLCCFPPLSPAPAANPPSLLWRLRASAAAALWPNQPPVPTPMPRPRQRARVEGAASACE
jgi:hypothetical protein